MLCFRILSHGKLENVCVAANGATHFSCVASAAHFLFWSGFMIITFCGHAQYTETEADEQKLLSLFSELIGDGYAELYLGGYGSFDAFARKCGRKYQTTHPNTRLIFVTPYITESYQKTHLNYNRNLYDEIIYPSLEEKPLRFAISYRNRWMAEKADCIIAYVTHEWGGAYKTYEYAKRMQKQIFNIAQKGIQ